MRITLVLVIALLLGLTLTPGSWAQKQKKDADPCENAKSNIELKECLAKEYEKADGELNAVYRQLTGLLEDSEEKDQLKTAQKAWLAFRDAHCEYVTFQNRGGTGYGGFLSACLTEVTVARTDQLRADAKERKSQ